MASMVRMFWLLALFALVILNCMLVTSYLSMQPIVNMVAQSKVQANETAQLSEKYLTLWLHQVHKWFRDKAEGKEKVRAFIQEAKESGFSAIMTNVPWAWTEREEQNDIRIDTFDKDFMDVVCEESLKLHIVLGLNEFPPWVSAQRIDSQNYSEKGSPHQNCNKRDSIPSPALAHPEVWNLISNFVSKVTWKLTTKYGDCIETISPTVNNEFETRYTQEFDKMRDYSFHSLETYRRWQENKGLKPIDAFHYPCEPVCRPIVDQSESLHLWLTFRQEFLAKKYEALCFLVHAEWNVENVEKSREKNPACLLHFGEFFATTDVLNSNLLFYLARSPVVDHVVMDSNMALLGAPSSPSIVGVMVSTAKAYGKTVHYEAATERVFPCTDDGKLQQVQNSSVLKAGARLLQEGLQSAIDAGVDCLGITNLCAPKAAVDMMPRKSRWDQS